MPRPIAAPSTDATMARYPAVPAPFGQRPGAAAVAQHVHLRPARAVGRGRRDLLDRGRGRHRHDEHGAHLGRRPRGRELTVVGEEAVHRGGRDDDRCGDGRCRGRWSTGPWSTRRAAHGGAASIVATRRRSPAASCSRRCRGRGTPTRTARRRLPRRARTPPRRRVVRSLPHAGTIVGGSRPWWSQRPARSARSSATLSQASSCVWVMRLAARITGTENAMRIRERGTYRASTTAERGDQADPRARAHRRAEPEGHRGGGGPQQGGGGTLVRDRPPELGRRVLEVDVEVAVGVGRAAPTPAAVGHHEDRQAHDDGDDRHGEADPHEALGRPPQLDDHRAARPGRTCQPLA